MGQIQNSSAEVTKPTFTPSETQNQSLQSVLGKLEFLVSRWVHLHSFRRNFLQIRKKREGRRVPLSYLIAPRDWASGGPESDTTHRTWDGSGCRERWALDTGMAQDHDASPSAAFISPSVLLIYPSKPAQCPAHCCHLQLCREVSWETSCVLATASSSGHCRAALAPSHLPCFLVLISAVVA